MLIMMTKIKLSGLLVYIILTFPFCIYSTHENNITKRESQPRTFSSGCNDAFSVFGFLAFLLALLDLIMELNATPAPVGRKKRFSSDNLVKNANEHRTDWKKENEGDKTFLKDYWGEDQWNEDDNSGKKKDVS